ncbi:FYVE-domain-containing protein, partial [Lophium mytilinum]
NTPANVSPTSPRTTNVHPNHARQLRPPKLPMYVPAVLRPTEKPSRQSPPKTGESGIDSAESSFGSVVRRATGDSVNSVGGTVSSEESNIEGKGPVTGPPSRNHWQPDNSTSVCTASCCKQPFSFLNRRHHCRRCGGIFCGAHSNNAVKLNQLALFHPHGALYRACDRCHTEYRQFEANRHSRSNSESSSGPVAIDAPPAAKRPQGLRVGSLVSSAPATWAWSTF